MTNTTQQFNIASEMQYAYNDLTIDKARMLILKLKAHLINEKKDKTLFFEKGETIYIPDMHGDFIHLMLTLYKHDAVDKDLNLKSGHDYVFLGDFYDRAPDSDLIDLWLNVQIKRNLKVHRLIGNHEMAFFERDINGYPLIFPSQDSIKDISNNFQITENLLKNIASGGIIAAYIDSRDVINHVSSKDAVNRVSTLYVHSYIINDDFTELGLEKNSDIINFATKLNIRLKQHGEYAYDLFLYQKKQDKFNWKAIMKSFNNDPIFKTGKKKDDISLSFIWRRTGLPLLNVYPTELEANIPDNVYQIVGHTPVFFFNLPKAVPISKPFVLKSKKGNGKVQFSDVGIGYYYRNDFERPEAVINRKLSIIIN